ncbi:MAG: N-acetyltransferase [Candidatus Cellulosilyticum pullistercoris]|uniref:N-acetyltransferase n=1 Tax=Candidatus Cellulosilyticum pullistercoris TaxID=2838521 RepID=A0A9E2KD91_9FIRM|nr:N-acetyltransferase [Candidatus Cellulosilyticum pullistercoris]
MLIRQENNKDFDQVYSVVKKAFQMAEHSDGNEQDLVVALRKSDAFIPELSLVAEMDGKIIGHIMFTKIEIGNHTALTLAPLAVLPEYQKQGVGAALIKEGHRIAKELGYQYSVVLGSERYYPRYGYIPAEQLGIKAPFEVASENFMAIKLQENAEPINGIVKYAKEFGI